MATAYTHIPPLPEFDPTQNWEDWSERLRFHLQVYRVSDDETKRAFLLSSCGVTTLGLARSLVAPDDLMTVTYDRLVTRLTDHFAPQPTLLARRVAFHSRMRKPQESATTFLAELRRLAHKCQFEGLDMWLLVQFASGQTDGRLKHKLLSTPDIDLIKALAIATASEQAPREGSRAPPGRTSEVHQGTTTDASDPEDDAVLRMQREPHRQNRASPRATGRDPEPRRGMCASCGDDHSRRSCRFRDATCRSCGREGHIARACRARAPREAPSSRGVPRTAAVTEDYQGTHTRELQVLNVPSRSFSQITVTTTIEGAPCQMQLDTGSSVSIISARTLSQLCPRRHPPLRKATFTLRDFQRQAIAIKGIGTFRVTFKGRTRYLELVVVEEHYVSLLGLSWFGPLGIEITGINRTAANLTDYHRVCEEFPSVFDGSLGLYKGPPVSLQLDPTVRPLRLKARRVPLALKPKIDEELDRLIEQGVLEPVPHGEWETPIVTPVKPNGSVRICADYKCTLNKALQDHAYPVPVVSHVLATLAGAKIFGKLDLAQAYQQLPVDAASADAQTIVTHRGAFRVKRLQFGVSVAPGIFQNLMDCLLKGIPGVTPFFDDVLIAAATEEDFTTRLRTVLQRFDKAGLKVKREKCLLGVPRVDFLGFSVDAAGIHPANEKVRAICNAPPPANKTELQAFLGLLNFYHAFLPHKAAIAEPLHRLLDKRTPWVWAQRHATAFQGVKDLLVSNQVLAHFDETLPVILACDASPYGVGAVLGHLLPDGKEVPVAYFSQTLSPAERNYAQIDKEGLAVVKGVKKFHDYLYGRPFTILTDHKPLLGLFAPDRQTPQMLSPRVLRWSIFLAGYQYNLQYRQGKAMGHADALSRLPLPETGPDPAPAAQVMQLEDLPEPPLHAADVARYTKRDRTLSRVLDWVWRGWPAGTTTAPEFAAFAQRQDELSAHKGCILWGSRVIVPPPLRRKVLENLHESHPGVVRMKALARSYVWWPGLDKEIEEWVSKCQTCQESRPAPPKAPTHSWESTRDPWSRLHADFAGPFQGQTFLIVVDSYSKWLEVVPVSTTSTAVTTRALRKLFATHGLADTLVTDNGTAFTSAEFQDFIRAQGMRHIRSAPFHPATNGQAERMVRTTKEALRRIVQGDWPRRLAQFLLAQHTTPCTATGRSPSELLMGRKLTTLLDRLHPDHAQEQPASPSTERSARQFTAGDLVYARNFGHGPSWVPASILRPTGPVSYEVITDQGLTWKRHVDQLRRRVAATDTTPADSHPPESERPASPAADHHPCVEEPAPATSVPETTAPADREQTAPPPPSPPPSPVTETQPEPARELRRSERTRKPPVYLKDYVCSATHTQGLGGEGCCVLMNLIPA